MDFSCTSISYYGCLGPHLLQSLFHPRTTRIQDQKGLSLPILETTRNDGFLLSSLEETGAVWRGFKSRVGL